jgi:uncharacterized protein YkwD
MVRAALLGTAALVAALAVAAPVSTAAGNAVQREASLERSIVDRINVIRAGHGLRPLALSTRLRAAAVVHTRSLANRGIFQHESPDGSPFHERVGRYYGTEGFRSWAVGENLVFNSAPLDAERAVKAWLDSPPHRKNLLSPGWREIGVGALLVRNAPGIYRGGTVVIATADFGTRSR